MQIDHFFAKIPGFGIYLKPESIWVQGMKSIYDLGKLISLVCDLVALYTHI